MRHSRSSARTATRGRSWSTRCRRSWSPASSSFRTRLRWRWVAPRSSSSPWSASSGSDDGRGPRAAHWRQPRNPARGAPLGAPLGLAAASGPPPPPDPTALPALAVHQLGERPALLRARLVRREAQRGEQERLHAVRQLQDLASGDRVECRNPARPEPHLRGGQHHVVHHDGRVDVGVAPTVELRPRPRLAGDGADTEHQRRLAEPLPLVDSAEVRFAAGGVDDDDPDRLLVRGGRGQAAGLQHLREQVVRDGIGSIGAHGVARADELGERQGSASFAVLHHRRASRPRRRGRGSRRRVATAVTRGDATAGRGGVQGPMRRRGGAVDFSRTIAAMPAAPAALPAWLAVLEARAPDLVAPFAALAEGRPLEVRRGIRARAGEGSAARILPQHAAIAEAYEAHLDALPDAAFGLPGGEADWTVAQALGHAIDASSGFVTAGVHDLMHLEQLDALAALFVAPARTAATARTAAMLTTPEDDRP